MNAQTEKPAFVLEPKLYGAEVKTVESALGRIRALVAAQAEDEGLWFEAETCAEAYLQQELRKLHAAVEAANGP